MIKLHWKCLDLNGITSFFDIRSIKPASSYRRSWLIVILNFASIKEWKKSVPPFANLPIQKNCWFHQSKTIRHTRRSFSNYMSRDACDRHRSKVSLDWLCQPPKSQMENKDFVETAKRPCSRNLLIPREMAWNEKHTFEHERKAAAWCTMFLQEQKVNKKERLQMQCETRLIHKTIYFSFVERWIGAPRCSYFIYKVAKNIFASMCGNIANG